MRDLDEGVARVGRRGGGAEAEGDLNDGHTEAVAGVRVACVVRGREARARVNEAIVDERGVRGRARLRGVVERRDERERGMRCTGRG